ncbi:MAG: hypothetical protein V3T64_02335 [Myxococcota bacterium]
MALTFSIELDPEGNRLLRDLERVSGSEFVAGKLLEFLEREAQLLAGFIVKNFLSGQVLARRTGELARSIVGKAERFEGGLPGIRVGVFRGPALVYAGVQEFGTRGLEPDSPFDTIRPVKAKALAFPPEGSPALTGAGVNRFPSPLDFPEKLRFIPFRKGVVVGGLFREADLRGTGADTDRDSFAERPSLANLQAVYLLITQLDLPAREYLKRGAQEFLPQIASDLAEFLAKTIRGRAA